MTSYTNTFTLVAGGVTVSFNVRPDDIKYDRQPIIAKFLIPGALSQTAVQNLGYGGYLIQLDFNVYGSVIAAEVFSITPITKTSVGDYDGYDIVAQLEDWATAGTVIALSTDYILRRNATVAMNVKIVGIEIMETSGMSHDYQVHLELQQYDSGSPI